MRKSIFLKTFIAILVFAVIILMIFSGIVSTFIYDYSVKEKQETLQRDVYQLSDYASLLYDGREGDKLPEKIQENLQRIAQEEGNSILLTDAYGTILFATNRRSMTGIVSTLSDTIMKDVMDGSFYEKQGTLGGVYQSNVYTVGAALEDADGNFMGAMFLSAATPYTEGMIYQFSKIMINASIIVMIISLFVSYIVTSEIIRPLKAMYRVVKEYSKGNFKDRVPVEGEDEISQLAVAFNDMAFNLQRLEETRNNFVSNVSHDLKTPMTTIGGFIDGILDGTIPPERERHYLEIVSQEVKRLSRLVRELLDVQRFESGAANLNRTKFNLCELASTVLIGFEQQINAKNLYVEVHFERDDMQVLADRDMIFRVIYNLLDNAVKFVNQDGIITVRINDEGKKIRCHIRNTGDGISSEEIKHIFDRFYKSDASRGLDKKGYGLGLFIVRSIIVAHEEAINVDSMENAYVEFNFTLPRA